MYRAKTCWKPIALLIGVIAVCLISGEHRLLAAGATYYVAPAGNDSNPGTETQPFRTIQRAANVVNPGDTVIVEDGTYTGLGSCATGTVKPMVCLTRGGTSAAWVTFQARNPLGAKLNGQQNANTDGIVFRNAVGYIRLEGFEIFGVGNPTASSSGIELYNGGHDVVISQVFVHDVGRLCTDTTNGEVGLYIQQPRVTVEQSRIAAIGRFAPGEQGCAPQTAYYKNHDHGIYVNSANDTRIINNVFLNMERGWPIQVYPGPVSNLSILHNTFIGGNPYQTGHIIIAASTTNGRIVNNLFDDPTTAALYFYSGTHTNLTIANNLTSQTLASRAVAGVVLSSNLEFTNPLLTGLDYVPHSDSPVIDRGLTLPDVRVDINRIARPQSSASDIGADERAGTSTEPPPPPAPLPTDTTPPTIAFTAPANEATVSRSVTFQVTAADNVGVVSVRFTVDGQVIATDTSAPFSASLRLKRPSHGMHTASAIATDAAGNTATATITFRD